VPALDIEPAMLLPAVPFKLRLPLLTVTPPVKVMAPDKTAEPGPVLVSPLAPLTPALIVALSLFRVVTEMVGADPAKVSEFAGVPPSVTVHPNPEVELISPKTRVPMVMGSPKVTIRSAVISTLAKFAVKPIPEATTPPTQGGVVATEVLQVPSTFVLQVPLAACADWASNNAAAVTANDLVINTD